METCPPALCLCLHTGIPIPHPRRLPRSQSDPTCSSHSDLRTETSNSKPRWPRVVRATSLPGVPDADPMSLLFLLTTWAPKPLALVCLPTEPPLSRSRLSRRLLCEPGGAPLVEPVPLHASARRAHVHSVGHGARARRARPSLPAHAHALRRALSCAHPALCQHCSLQALPYHRPRG